MLHHKLQKYCMSSATKIRVMMDRGDAAARYTFKIKRIKESKNQVPCRSILAFRR